MADLYEDLLKDTSKSYEDGNYFLVTITDLNPNTSYPIQFKWTYKDGFVNNYWSAVRVITTPGESEPNTPKFDSTNVDTSQTEKIIITWSGTSDDNTTMSNYDRVDVYIDGAPFDGTKAAYSFKAPGTTIIPAPAGTYQIVLYAVSKTGVLSPVSSAVTKTVSGSSVSIVAPETPTAPTVTAGLASVIVEWDGKRYDSQNFSTGSFAGAKVFIGTSAGFTPSNDNWVHTLNFANGANKVSIGVGTIINKSTNATLQYGTPYYIKIDTINANGTANNNPISASGNPVTVSKLPASEISTGILTADNSITAGVSEGQRVVISGSSAPFIIYGTDGTTKLLEYVTEGTTGSLAIKGSGTFTGSLAIGTSPNIFKAEPATGIWLGGSDGTYANADFRVSNNGVLRARAGTIGGWTLGSTYLQGTNLKLDTSGIVVGATTSSYLDIAPSAITHRNSDGTASGKFTLTLGASPQLTISGTIALDASSTIDGTNANTVKTNAAAGATALQADGTYVQKNSSNQIIRLSTAGGITISSSTGSSGSRIEMTNTGFYAYDTNNVETVSIAANSGDAVFRGTIRTNAPTSYPRIEILSTTNRDYINFYDANNAKGYINVSTNGSGAMYFTAPGATAGTSAAASQIALYGPGHAINPKITRLIDADATYRVDITTSGIYGKIHTTNVELLSITSSGLHFNSDYNALGVDNTHVDGSFIRNIQSTTTTGYPTSSGRYGDIVLVREA